VGNGNILRNGIILNNNNIDINNGKVLSLDNTFKGEIYIISTDKVFNFVKEASEIELDKKSDYSFKEILTPLSQTLFFFTENDVKDNE